MRDGSVDKTYKPLSGKVMLGRWLKWKLCTNIYTSLMGPSRICRAVWAAYSDGTLRACTRPCAVPTPAASVVPKPSQTVKLQTLAGFCGEEVIKRKSRIFQKDPRDGGLEYKTESLEFYSARGKS